MGQGYTRTDTINNIADGNIINAADFDAEYDAIESAFNSSTGHSHDGTSGEGGPITVLGPAQDFVASTTEIKPKSNNTLDIGTTGLKFKDLHLQGTANLPTVDIDAGAIDGAIVGANSAAAGTFTNLTASTNLTLASGATVTAILDEDNLASDSDTSLATQQSIKAYVDGQIAGTNELSEILANGNTTAGTGIDLIDNDKIRFGTGNDLEIFHDASDSIINDAGTGSLKLQQGGATKLEVTSTGVTVADDLVVNDDVSLSSDAAVINLGADGEVTLTHQADVGVLLDVENATTNGVTDVLKLQAKSTGTPAVGIGTGIEFSTETAASTIETGGVIESVAAGLTPTAEEFDMIFKTMSSGATAAERLKLNGSGATIGNINLDGNTIISTDTNGSIVVAPNGTGDVQLDADTVRVGDNNANATITTNGTGDLILNTNAGSSSGSITIEDAANGNIALTPNGTGEVDITKVDIDGGAIDGTIIGANSAAAGTFAALEGTTVTASTSLALASGATVTAILDEDDMSTNSATALATQQSIKAFVENTISGGSFGSGITSGGNITLNDDGNSSPNGFGLVFKEASATYTTTLNKTTPTANRTISLPNETGTVSTQAFANGAAVALAIALG
jgi:hypothetical protein